jgi:hypothetical protein
MTEKKRRGVNCPTCAEHMRRLWTKKNVKDGTISHVHECKNAHRWRVFKGVPVEQIKTPVEVDGKKIISRAEALKNGLPHYFTGFTCKHGHMSEKWTKNGYCIACKNEFIETKRSIEKNSVAAIEEDVQTQEEIRLEFEELRRRHPSIRRIQGYAQGGSK